MYSNPRPVPQILLSSHILVQDSDNLSLSMMDFDPRDLKTQVKTCIEVLVKGNAALKQKEEGLRESRTQTRQSNRDPEAKTKVIDVRSQSVLSNTKENRVPSPPSFNPGNLPSNLSSSFNFPSYSHGIDPVPQVPGTFMDQHHSKKSSQIVDVRKKALEAKYEAYLVAKKKKNDGKQERKTIFMEGEKIKMLKMWFEENSQAGKVTKNMVIDWILSENGVFRMFGLRENSRRSAEFALENIGTGSDLTLDEFLGFYQVSRNNKDPNVSVTTLSSEEDLSTKPSDLTLSGETLEVIREALGEVGRPTGVVQVLEKENREVLEMVAREPQGVSRFQRESVREVLRRAGEREMQWEELVEYFTVRGEPGADTDSPVLQRSHSADNTPLGTRYSITVPSPFHFYPRSKSTIRQAKLQAMLSQRLAQEQQAIQPLFHAHSVPAEVLIPQYQQILHKEQLRRQEVRANSVKLTKSREKPFSFYYRDMNKPKPSPVDSEPYVFKANPVPWKCTVPLYDRMVSENEEIRKDRIESRAQILLQQAKLPSRMENTVTKTTQKSPKRAKSVKIPVKPVPDFATLQAEFQEKLEKGKSERKNTVPEPFEFAESRKTAKYRDYLDQVETEKEWRRKKQTDLEKVFRRPSKEPSTTEKQKSLIALRKQEQASKELAHSMAAQQALERQQRQERVRPLVHHSPAIREYNQGWTARRQEMTEERRRELRELGRQTQIEREEMMERVYARPLLVEQVSAGRRREAVQESEEYG